MKKIVLIPFILLSCIYADQVTLTFNPVSSTEVDIMMVNDVEVGGFQFDISGLDITHAFGGSATDAGFILSPTRGSTVIGFSLSGATIPAGEGTLVKLEFEEPSSSTEVRFKEDCWPGQNNDGCAANELQSFSDAGGNSIPVIHLDWFDFSGCSDINAPEYESHNIIDDESCSCYDDDCLDCAGNAGGVATLNGCGTCICNGSEAAFGFVCTDVEECIQGCDGNYANDGTHIVEDECGVCDGDDTSCLPVEIQFNNVIISDSLLSIELTNFQIIRNLSFKLSGVTDIELLSSSDSFSEPTIIDTLVNFSNGNLDAGTHLLLSLKYSPLTSISCISEVSVFGDGLDPIGVIVNECADIAIIGCTEQSSCNYNSSTTLNECIYPENDTNCCPNGLSLNNEEQDCLGVCGGSGAIENYGCDGSCIEGVVKDECGVCGGNNSLCIPSSSNYLLLSQISTIPDEGQFITIKNTSDESISLKNHYITDDKNYYKIQSGSKKNININDFIARLPDDSLIGAGDSINICFSSEYNSFLPGSFICDYMLKEDLENIFDQGNSIGEAVKLTHAQEMVALFYWDGDKNHPVRDVDYFLWGNWNSAMYKSVSPWYYEETLAEEQDFFVEPLKEYYSYSRISNDELESIGYNGYLGQDETSEAFNSTWGIEIIDGFNLFEEIMDGNFDCSIDSREACEDGTQSSASSGCPLVDIEGILVDFGDYTTKNGPFALTLEDAVGFRLELTIWDNTWDIKDDDNYSILTVPPFHDFKLKATGNVYTYNGNRQVYVCGPNEIEIIESYNLNGVQEEFETNKVSINPAPFIIIPGLNENLNFTYTFPDNSRVIINIFDLSGRFITSLEDSFFAKGGTVYRDNVMQNEPEEPINASAWDGRDQLGQIVPPGTYIMHLEVFNPATGETKTDAAPIVVGVKN